MIAMAKTHQNGRSGMTIGQVADSVGVAATALRYYEREGILGPSSRSAAGYRLYDARTLERIRFLCAAQSAGFTLADIKSLLALAEEEPATCRATVQTVITARLADVKKRISALKRVEKVLELGLTRCRASKNACPVLNELGSKRSKGEKQ